MENHAAEIKLAERRNEQRLEALDIRQYRAVYWTRLALRVLSMILCALIIMSLVDVTRTYEKTKHLTNPFREGSGSFPVWPMGLKLYPSYVLLGAAVVAGFFSLVLVLASFVKSVRLKCDLGELRLTGIQIRRMTKTGNIVTVIVSSICLVLWVSVTAWYESWDTSETNWDLLYAVHHPNRYCR